MNETTVEFYKRCNENQFQLVEVLREEIREHEVEAKASHLQARNLQFRISHQSTRISSLESQLDVLHRINKQLTNDKETIQESLDEFGSDTVEVIELSLDERLTMEEMTIYREGMKVINKGYNPVWDNAGCRVSPCFTRQDIENIVLDVLGRVCIR